MSMVTIKLRRLDASNVEQWLRESSAPQPFSSIRALGFALESALRPPRRSPRAQRFALKAKKAKSIKHSTKREETRAIWEACRERSDGYCECGCGRWFQEEGPNKPEMDHQASRREPQSVFNCWLLAQFCHDRRQKGEPDTRYWLDKYIRHCRKHVRHESDQYAAEARRAEARLRGIVEVREDEKRRRSGV